MKKYTLIASLFLAAVITFAQTKEVLFIGNSITASGIPEMLSSLAQNNGDDVYTEQYWNGQLLYEYVKDSGTVQMTRDKFSERNWDYIVLQENSQVSGFYPGWTQGYFEYYSYQAAKDLNVLAKNQNPCAEIMFFMTYGYLNGDVTNFPDDTYLKQQTRIRRNYKLLADSNSAVVAPVGMAWKKVRDEKAWGDELYIPGDHHPANYGSYLAACVFYATILQKSPVGIPYYADIDSTRAKYLQSVAYSIVFDSADTWNINKNVPNAEFSYQVQGDVIQSTSDHFSNYFTHEWFVNGNYINKNENMQYVAPTPGDYEVKHIVRNDCYKPDSIIKSITISPNSISGKIFNSNVEIFPNPSSGEMTLRSTEKFSARIYDARGKLICEFENSGSTESISNLKTGIYLIRVCFDDVVLVRKVIVN